jgi:hypothetical protein
VFRDELEATIRSWDAYERDRGATPVIDYDFSPDRPLTTVAATSRVEILERLRTARQAAPDTAHARVLDRLNADIAYLGAVLGVRPELSTYIRQTQGCGAEGWPSTYITTCGELARGHLADLGIPWDETTTDRLEEAEGRLATEEAPRAIRQAATELEPLVRRLSGTDAPFSLSIETTDVDAYWAYWLDGAGENARLRLNLRRARFTRVLARQFALHEVLGHALQGASLAARCAKEEVPWVRLLSVHAPQQVLFEGLAQALPLFVLPEDEALTARVRLAHFTQLVRAELHLAINSGKGIEACVRIARDRVPFWKDEAIGDALSDTSTNPLLRTYLWAYPAGIDWFVSLVGAAPETATKIIRTAYREPLTPEDLAALWPDGPSIGGPGATVDG